MFWLLLFEMRLMLRNHSSWPEKVNAQGKSFFFLFFFFFFPRHGTTVDELALKNTAQWPEINHVPARYI